MKLKNIIDIAYSGGIFMASKILNNKENIWMFGAQGGNNYSDNAKYFFEWMLENHKEEECYWVTKDKNTYRQLSSRNIPVLYFYDLKSIKLIAQAKYIICTHSHIGNDVYKFVSQTKTLITLWHGIPLKKMGKLPKKRYRDRIGMKSQPDLFLVTSSNDAELFSDLYEIDRDKFFVGNYPRVNDLISKAEDKKTILYAPTFRDRMSQDYYDEHIFPTIEELHTLNETLIKFDYHFFIKMHPYVQADFPNLNEFSNIELVSAFDDVQDYLAQANVLITDYSSIYFDYLNLDREIIFFIPDYNWYSQASNRGLLYEYEDVTPGVKVTSWQQVESSLISIFKNDGINDFSEERKEVLNVFYTERVLGNIELLQRCKQIS
ncbi:CDP-glycerol glycerophosphotransferase family protein [uncultured Psychrobacter sp.]|uniref:CDP-glycerol glycerophosphotransferase family protein n=1 Tax=uncultured Psychrobacter sp. TaxID=259303 RepID=UPI00262A4CCF|nr:CDP-glycerol glycerophosphotransferase family protein [uncultured Psychrobacter sp.]